MLGPDNGAGHKGQIPHMEHLARLGLHVPHFELFVKDLNVILDPLDQLGLVFPDVGPDEQGVESGEDPEHFIGILSCEELIPEPDRDSGLNPINSLITYLHSSLPNLTTLLSNTETINSLHILTSKVDPLDGISINSLQSNDLWLDLLLQPLGSGYLAQHPTVTIQQGIQQLYRAVHDPPVVIKELNLQLRQPEVEISQHAICLKQKKLKEKSEINLKSIKSRYN